MITKNDNNKMNNLVYLLLIWHKTNRRDYPWRNESSAYRIMIAEFMLQRTKADQVLPVYKKFIVKYPDIFQLANSTIEDIKDLIKPLGLTWRASHFKKSAEYIVSHYNGRVPSTKKELLEIPGIGEYIAGAILAVAYSKKTSIVDSNIARTLNRYYGLNLAGEIRRNKEIIKLAEKMFSVNNPKKVLFCIIDFSAIICTPTSPKHNICPVKDTCIYFNKLSNK